MATTGSSVSSGWRQPAASPIRWWDRATQVCSTSTIDVTGVGSSTTTTPTNSSITLGGSNTDSATITGSRRRRRSDRVGGLLRVRPDELAPRLHLHSWTQFDTESLCWVEQPGHGHLGLVHPGRRRHLVLRRRLFRRQQLHRQQRRDDHNECFTVNATGSSTTSSPTSSSISLGESNTDNATVTGSVNTVRPDRIGELLRMWPDRLAHALHLQLVDPVRH